MECFPDYTFFMADTKIQEQALVCAIFSKTYVACAINHAGKLICLRACLRERNCSGLIDQPEQAHYFKLSLALLSSSGILFTKKKFKTL